ncbi:Pectate lyase superfamily protein [uncultured Caudovirales phage]|uniref:Pectate lyase superfamily protein n=1 Tax=uncultured Caudovirales phage TaxID=2100421 RepID=A0A6J5LWX3_9CAUD|nr:Pectate lyase superfamily protein [uncultured Caudovirales phage]
MSKVPLNNIGSAYGAIGALNDNFNSIEEGFNNTLSRDGTGPNFMLANLDMNSKDILNVGTLNVSDIQLDGVPLEPGNAVAVATVTPFEFTATAGQTIFSVAPYTPLASALIVEVNGSVLKPSDVSVTNSNVTITARTLSDKVVIRVFNREVGGDDGSRFYLQPGGVVRSVVDNALDVVSAFDFMTTAQIASVRARDLALDVTAALQTAIDTCSSTTQYSAKCLYLPAGRYKISSSLLMNKEFVHITGAGKWATEIYLSGTHSGFNTSSIPYLRPFISDLGIWGGNTSNYGIFFGNVTNQVYLGELKNIIIYSGNDGVYARGNGTNSNFFSMSMDGVEAYSHNGHSFIIRSGPGNTFKRLYALRAGPGKAGFRMAGLVHLDGCNGLNEGDFWGVFGNDPTDTPGFGDDFSGNDYIDLTLSNCNIEEWSSLTNAGTGILFHNGIRSFVMNGGKFDRSRAELLAVIPNCHSIVRARLGPNNPGNPIELRPSAVFMGTGGYTATPLFADTGATFTDPIGSFNSVGITTFRQNGLDYPLPYKQLTNDRFQNYSFFESSLEARHLTANVIRFRENTVNTTGSNLNVDVTGVTRVKLTAGSATSVNRFSFLVTPGNIAQDYLRNGELIVEATSANVTLNHNQSGTGKMMLSANLTRTLLPGEIVRFMWRESDSAWVETGGNTLANSITNADLGGFLAETPATIASVFFAPAAHYAQRIGGFVTGFGAFDFRAQGTAGADAVWSVTIPFDAGWAAPWSDLAVGLWSAQDGSVHGQITKKIGATNKLLFVCATTSAVIAATKTCRFQYTYRTFA